MPNPRLAARYAKSLIDLAIEQNSLEPTLADVQLLDSICHQSRDFVSMLKSPIIKSDKKQQIIKAVVGSNVSAITSGFINLLVNKGRESNLPEIASAFIAQYREMKNIRSVKLTTAAPINDTLKEQIMKAVAGQMTGKSIELKTYVNPDLIGGFVLETGDRLFDASIRKDLNDIKAQFLKNMYVSELR